MIYRKLGKTDIEVSAITVGTAAWGLEGYGDKRVKNKVATQIMEAAIKAGVTFFDTASSYWSDKLVCEYLADKDVIIGSKWSAEFGFGRLGDMSPTAAARPFFMFHNARTVDIVRSLNRSSFDKFSVYVPEETLSCIVLGAVAVQFPYNLLDTRHEFAFGKIGTMARSPLLRGKLASMAEEALRFSFFSGADTTVLGINSIEELDFALECLEKGPIDYDEIIDPRRWK